MVLEPSDVDRLVDRINATDVTLEDLAQRRRAERLRTLARLLQTSGGDA